MVEPSRWVAGNEAECTAASLDHLGGRTIVGGLSSRGLKERPAWRMVHTGDREEREQSGDGMLEGLSRGCVNQAHLGWRRDDRRSITKQGREGVTRPDGTRVEG